MASGQPEGKEGRAPAPGPPPQLQPRPGPSPSPSLPPAGSLRGALRGPGGAGAGVPAAGARGGPEPGPGPRPRATAMVTWRRDGRLTGGQRLVCAGLAGALSLSLTAPLELATVRAQVGAGPGQPRGPWAACRSVWRAEGPRALWKGNGVACLRLFPYSVLQLAAYRKFILVFVDDLGYVSQLSAIMAGSLAGMVATIVTYPSDVIKTRLIMQDLLKPSYKGICHAFCTIYQQEGFLALYRGVSLTILGALPFSAGSFLVYVNLNRIWNGRQDRFSPLQNFANSCLAAGVAQTISYPFDTMKRKMQVSHL